MASIDELKARRDTYQKAIDAVMIGGKEVQIGTRKITREDVDKIQGLIDRIDQEIAAQQTVAPFWDNAYQVYFEGR